MRHLRCAASSFQCQSHERLDEIPLVRDHGIRITRANMALACRTAPSIVGHRLIRLKRNLALAVGTGLYDLELAAGAAKIPVGEVRGAARTVGHISRLPDQPRVVNSRRVSVHHAEPVTAGEQAAERVPHRETPSSRQPCSGERHAQAYSLTHRHARQSPRPRNDHLKALLPRGHLLDHIF